MTETSKVLTVVCSQTKRRLCIANSEAPRARSGRWSAGAITIIALLVAMIGSLAWMASNISSVARPGDTSATEPILVTAEVESRLITERTLFRGVVGPSSTSTIYYHGRTEDGHTPLLTWAPAAGEIVREGEVILEVSGRPVILIEGVIPGYRDIGVGSSGPDVEQFAGALSRLGLLDGDAVGTEWNQHISAAVVTLYESLGYRPSQIGRTLNDTRRLELSRIRIPLGEVWTSPKAPLRVEATLIAVGQAIRGDGLAHVTDDELVINATMDSRQAQRFLEDPSYVLSIQEGGTSIRLSAKGILVLDHAREQSNLILIPETRFEESQRGVNALVVAERPLQTMESLVVPSSAVSVTSSGQATVGLLMDDGSVRAVAVEVGPSSGGYVSIRPLDGAVVAGDLVVLGFRG